MPHTREIVLIDDVSNGMYKYQIELYEGVDPEFLITDPKMSKEEWLSRILQKLPLEHLPDNLRPKYKRGIQPPTFHFGFLLKFEDFYEKAKRLNFIVHYAPDARRLDLPQINSSGQLSAVEDDHPADDRVMNVEKTIKCLGRKLKDDLKIMCNGPRLEFVLNETPMPTVTNLFLSFMSSYDGWQPQSRPDPEELSARTVDYLGLKEPLKWYLDAEDCYWSAGGLVRRSMFE